MASLPRDLYTLDVYPQAVLIAQVILGWAEPVRTQMVRCLGGTFRRIEVLHADDPPHVHVRIIHMRLRSLFAPGIGRRLDFPHSGIC
jgi:hypothetical protein